MRGELINLNRTSVVLLQNSSCYDAYKEFLCKWNFPTCDIGSKDNTRGERRVGVEDIFIVFVRKYNNQGVHEYMHQLLHLMQGNIIGEMRSWREEEGWAPFNKSKYTLRNQSDSTSCELSY